MAPSDGEITRLLSALKRGDTTAESQLIDLVYRDFHAIAQKYMRKERSDHTLQPTALVHEAYLRLMQNQGEDWQGRAHFFAAASVVMRRILVDHARRELREKHGGGVVHVALDNAAATPEANSVDAIDALALDRALEKLESLDPTQGKVVELRFFGGLTVDETAAAMGLSTATIKREWALAKGWLHRELSGM